MALAYEGGDPKDLFSPLKIVRGDSETTPSKVSRLELPDEFRHDAYVEGIIPEPERIVPLGLRHTEHYAMSNGFTYRTDTYLPDAQLTDIPVDMTTGWLLSPRGPLYIEWVKMLMELGYPVRVIGPGKLPDRKQFSAEMSDLIASQAHRISGEVRLAHIASNNLHILNAKDADPRVQGRIAPGSSLLMGYSRGAMIAAIEHALAEEFGRTIIASYEMDPNLSNTAQMIGRLLSKPLLLRNEFIASEHARRRAKAKVSEHRQWDVEGTDASLEHVIPALDTAKALRNGDACRIAPYTPSDARRIIIYFDNGLVAEPGRHPYPVAEFPFIQKMIYPGAHMSMGRDDVMDDTTFFFTHIAQKLSANGTFTDHDFEELYMQLDETKQFRESSRRSQNRENHIGGSLLRRLINFS